MKIKEILLEINAVNTEDVKIYINQTFAKNMGPEIESWFNKQFYRWAINR